MEMVLVFYFEMGVLDVWSAYCFGNNATAKFLDIKIISDIF